MTQSYQTLDSITMRPPKFLLYGAPGSGKTPFVTSFGEGMLLLDCDDGLRSSLTLVDRWQADRKKIAVKQFIELDPTKALVWSAMKEEVRQIVNACNAKTFPYKILAIDSFTVLADSACRYIAGNSGALNNPAKMSQQMWGLAIGEIENLFMWLKALPIPVVCVFHEREGAEGDTTTREIAIFGKNLPARIVGYFDEVLRVRVRSINGKMEPYLQTNSDGVSIARSRQAIPNGTKTDIGFRELIALTKWKV